jgi:murein DD-endopeptidase MepM/ murein hydrolase activator NlpD
LNEQKNLIVIGITILFFAVIIASDFLRESDADSLQAQVEQINEAPEISYIQYPFQIKVLDSLKNKKLRVKKNDTFFSILLDGGVPLTTIHELVQSSKQLLDAKRINLKRDYHFFYEKGSKEPRFFVFEESVRDYIKVEFSNPIRIEKGRKEAVYKEFIVSAKINQTLYSSLTENKLDGALANQIADLMAWQIDFHRMQKGDNYQLILEQELVDDKVTGEYSIKALRFNHNSNLFYAFRFMEDGITRYYDEEGNSLEKTFLKAPLKFSRVSSGYSANRFHPVLKYNRPHLGIDYAAPRGTPVYAVADGLIEEAGFGDTNGNYVRIRHNGTTETGYLHFSRIATGIKKGKRVRQGQVIGYVGDTGLATGPHLCFRYWKNGHQVNPANQYNPPARPIDQNLKNKYLSHIRLMKAQLDKMDLQKKVKNDSSELTSL